MKSLYYKHPCAVKQCIIRLLVDLYGLRFLNLNKSFRDSMIDSIEDLIYFYDNEQTCPFLPHAD